MSRAADFLSAVLERFNASRFWRARCRVWDQTMAVRTFDRWLYLRLHRLGIMGNDERKRVAEIIRPGMTVLDIGANLGLYSVLLSRLVGPEGRVLSFEPDPTLCELLRENCALNGCTNVEVHNLAVGSQNEELVLQKLILNSGDNTLGPRSGKSLRREIAVKVVALDQFMPDLKPDIVKVDVQGWELKVLMGMQGLLAANPQTKLYLEYWPKGFRRAGYAPSDLTDFLLNRHWKIRLASEPTGQPMNRQQLEELTRQHAALKYTDLFVSRQ